MIKLVFVFSSPEPVEKIVTNRKNSLLLHSFEVIGGSGPLFQENGHIASAVAPPEPCGLHIKIRNFTDFYDIILPW